MSLSKQALCLADPQSNRAAGTNDESCFLGGDDAVLQKTFRLSVYPWYRKISFLQHAVCLRWGSSDERPLSSSTFSVAPCERLSSFLQQYSRLAFPGILQLYWK